MVFTEQKHKSLEEILDKSGIISALVFDQRGALEHSMAQCQDIEPTIAQVEKLRVLIAGELIKYVSSILPDPEYGPSVAKALDKETGLPLAYEETGYDTSNTKRLPGCSDVWSAKHIKE